MTKILMPKKTEKSWWVYSLINPADRVLALKKIRGILRNKKGLIGELKKIRKEWDRPLPKF